MAESTQVFWCYKFNLLTSIVVIDFSQIYHRAVGKNRLSHIQLKRFCVEDIFFRILFITVFSKLLSYFRIVHWNCVYRACVRNID